MSYTEIPRLRDLLARDPGLLNPTQRLILILIVTYDNPTDPRGCFVAHEELLKLIKVKTRSWQENIHHLTDGKGKWENNKRIPCTNPECLGKVTHLQVVKRTGRAYKNNAQGYKPDLDRYEQLLSMHYGAPFSSVIDLESMHLETVERAPENTKERATVHPYKQDKQDKQQQEGSYVISFNKLIQTKVEHSKRFHADKGIVDLLDKLEAKSITFKAVETALEALGADWIKSPKAFTIKALQTLLEGEPDWNMSDNKPPHCGECDPVTRKLSYRYIYRSNPEGANTDQCDKCNPYGMRNERV